MFRRKEDSLFDNTTDPNQPKHESAMSANPQSQAHPHQQPAGNAAPSYGNNPVPPSQQAQAPRPAAPAAAGSFRNPATPIGADLNRNRMPEAKTSVAGAMAAPSAAPVPGADKRSGKRVLTVGNDILLKGEIATCDRLVIEGKVDATLNDVHTVEIAEQGSFKGSANIEDAEISGLFEGDLVVRNRLIIYATGKVRGKIAYGEIEIERGGELTGEIKTSAASNQASAPRPPRQKEAA